MNNTERITELEDGIRGIVNAWEGGDLAGAVNEAAGLLPDESDMAAYPYECAECGATRARTYVVTTLDYEDPKETRTEVCLPCHEVIATGDRTQELLRARLREYDNDLNVPGNARDIQDQDFIDDVRKIVG